jgi:hypothetical protein
VLKPVFTIYLAILALLEYMPQYTDWLCASSPRMAYLKIGHSASLLVISEPLPLYSLPTTVS